MARRHRNDPTGCALAIIGNFALLTVVALAAVAESHPAAAGLCLTGLAGLGVWVAIYKVRARNQRRALWAARANAIASYLTMDPAEFEHALAYLCRRDGCTDVRVVGGAGDLAADVIATTPDGRRIVIQAKRYSPGVKVGSGDVQKVNGTYEHEHGAHLAAIVTTSRFTKPAQDFADRVGIELFDIEALAGWVSRTGPAPWH